MAVLLQEALMQEDNIADYLRQEHQNYYHILIDDSMIFTTIQWLS